MAETFLHAAIGARLIRYAIDVEAASLTPLDEITAPEKIQYLWRHPSAAIVYLCISDGGPGNPGTRHALIAYRIADDGSLNPLGEPAPLRHRPLHLCTDLEASHLLTAYNNPSDLTVHALAADGSIGAEVIQSPPLDPGIFAHQIRMLPSGKAAVLVTRGNDATADRPEDPGSLRIFDYANGHLTARATIAPNDGYGFGARHLDIHSDGKSVAVSVERQNRLHLYALNGEDLSPEPVHDVNSLMAPQTARPRQHAGAIHIHPNGRVIYQSNRADTVHEVDGERVFLDGENSIAVYEVDEATGAPTRIQNVPTEGFVPRTFAVHPSGELLIAGNSIGMKVRDGDAAVRDVPPSLAVYRIAKDGTLDLVRIYAMDAARESMFWIGLVG